MTTKPTYEELLDRIAALEKKERTLTRIQRSFTAVEAKANAMMANMHYPVYLKDMDGNIVESNAPFNEHPFLGAWAGGNMYTLLPEEQASRLAEYDRNTLSEYPQDFTETFFTAEGDRYLIRIVQFPVQVSSRKTLIGAVAMHAVKQEDDAAIDTAPASSEVVKLREKLKSATQGRKEAESMLKKSEEKLEDRASNLRDVNTALQVLLKKRDEDKRRFEERVLFNVKEMVLPYMEKIREVGLSELQTTMANILEENLKEIISPFSPKLASRYYGLTNMELKVANLVRQGKSNKEISKIFKLSKRTIESHRDSIRKKIGINKKKKNLRTYLLSMD